MQTGDEFCLETLVDFPDDALTCPFPVTHGHIDSMMRTLADIGIRRVVWGYYGDGHGGYLLPAGIAGGSGDPAIAFDQTQWRSYAQTLEALGDPLRVAVQAAHRHGLELYGYFKPYETGVSMLFPEGSPQAREWGRLPHIGGYLSWLDPFVLQHPHLRIQRRADDLLDGAETAAIRTLRLTKKDDSPTRITRDNLQIWTSDRNYRYTRKPLAFDLIESVEPSPRDVLDVYGNLLTRRGDPVRVLTLHGFSLDDRYILVTTDFEDGPGDFENAWDRILAAFDAQGREVPGVFATGTEIWFPEHEDFVSGGLCFDSGRGPEAITLDRPHHATVDSTTGSAGHHLPGQRKVQGFIAYARGRNAFLPGALCETEPAVQDYWLSCLGEILDTGADGVEFRVENHSSHTDTPQDYGFNSCVLDRVPPDSDDLPGNLARIRGAGYTEFLRKAKSLVASRAKRMRVNLNVDWFRPAAQRPGSRKLAFPANIDFDWQTWVSDGLMDEATLRAFAKPFANVFGGDEVAQAMVCACRERGIPITLNRYVWSNPDLAREVGRARADGRFAGLILYETWSYMQFTQDGGCVMAHTVPRAEAADASEVGRRRAETSTFVQDVLQLGSGKGGPTHGTSDQ